MKLDKLCVRVSVSFINFCEVILWKSLICTLLLYLSLTAVTYCSLVPYVDRHLLSDEGDQSNVAVRGSGGQRFSDDQKSDSIQCNALINYIAVISLCITYTVYVFESYSYPIRKELRNKMTLKKCLSLVRTYTQSFPIIWWRAICYHYARRSKQITSVRNGERILITQEYLERLDTNTALSAFDFSQFRVEDVTRLPPKFNSKPITEISFFKSFGFANAEAENEYLAQRSSFLMESESKDDYIETCEGMNLSDVDFLTEVVMFNEGMRPWFISHALYCITTFVGFSYPFRLLLKCYTVHVDVTIEKIFCKLEQSANLPSGRNGTPQQPQSMNSHENEFFNNWNREFNLAVELPPAYSDALMWEPTEKGTLSRKYVNKSTQMSRNQSLTSVNAIKPIVKNTNESQAANSSKVKIKKSESLRSIGKVLKSPSTMSFAARGRATDGMINSKSFGHVIETLDNRTTYCVHFDKERCLINVANNPLPRSYQQNHNFRHQCDTVTEMEINGTYLESGQLTSNGTGGTSENRFGENQRVAKPITKSFSLFSFNSNKPDLK